MNTYRTIFRSVCAALTAVLLVALVPSVALAAITTSGTPTITVGYGGATPATVQVGQTLMCNNLGVTFNDPDHPGAYFQIGFNWYHQGSTTSISTMQSYAPAASDIGFGLECTVTGTEPGVSPAQSAPSTPTPIVTPVPAVTLTQYSPKVSGNVGEATQGIGVTLTLMRWWYANGPIGETIVGSGQASTDLNGGWTTSLTSSMGGAGNAVIGLGFDQLLIHYSGAAALPPDVTYTLSGQYGGQFLGASSTISADGRTVAIASQGLPCTGDSIVVNDGTPQGATVGANNDCVYTSRRCRMSACSASDPRREEVSPHRPAPSTLLVARRSAAT